MISWWWLLIALPLSTIFGYMICALMVVASRADNQASFDLRWEADMRAIKRWQESSGKVLVWPDHTDLCVWLLEENERLVRAFKYEQDERCAMFTQVDKDIVEIETLTKVIHDVAPWLSAALEDPKVCDEFREVITLLLELDALKSDAEDESG
jgi:hypothetical protein